jgi:hypothetical protein
LKTVVWRRSVPSVVITAKGFGREKRSRLTRPLAASTGEGGQGGYVSERGHEYESQSGWTPTCELYGMETAG